MAKVKVIIIEDEFFAANHLSDVITDLGYWVVGVYHSGEEFLSQTDWNFDAAVVDIFLSAEMTGIGVGEHLKNKSRPFIFLTANQDSRTLNDAARLSPKAYISKPFQINDVAAALAMISHERVQMLEVRGSNGTEVINPNDIYFIKSDGAYVKIYTSKNTIVQRKLLKEIEDVLPEFFVRVHRSYLVNRQYIEQRTANELSVHGHVIPISRSYKETI